MELDPWKGHPAAQKPTNKGDEDHRIPDTLNTEDIKKWVGGNEK